ncbi:hypothetical protein DFQ30_000379 [Apophysomyces sp. BC1015]|nr:hypothetical protein DFQ30_000379 [Apophysomyces sp. BC1015]KAG0168217.1 hypothetical protein DFQ29_010253 [Apophysomyces sp. BC1021]
MDAWAADEEVTEFTTRKSTSHRGVSDAWFKKLRIINLVHRTLADFINDNKENFTIWTVPTKVASQTVMNECDKQESLEKCRYQKDLWSPHFDKANILRKNRHAYQMEGLKLLGEASSGCSKIMSRALEAPSNQQDDDEGDDTGFVDSFSSQDSTPNRRKRTLVLINDDLDQDLNDAVAENEKNSTWVIDGNSISNYHNEEKLHGELSHSRIL